MALVERELIVSTDAFADAPDVAPPMAEPPGERAEETRPSGSLPRWYPLAQVAMAAGYLGIAWDRIAGPVGLNADGQNLGVFALGARAIRTDGPIASYLGSHLAIVGDVYANHPPLIYWLTAASESTFGVHPWSTRLPVTLAALSLIWTIPLLLRRLGNRPSTALVAAAVALACPMFLVYGPMLDTPMLGLAVSAAALCRWVRHHHERGLSPWPMVAIGVLASLAGWEAVLLCGVLGVVGWWRHRRDPGASLPSKYLVIAVGTTAALVAAWIRWSYGSMDGFVEQFLFRTGQQHNDFTVIGAFDIQSGYLADMFRWPLIALGGAGAVVAIRRPATRFIAAPVVGVVATYSGVFWQAATYHRYWHYWLLLPLAIGTATVAEGARHRFGRVGSRAVLAVAVALIALGTLVPSEGQVLFEDGLAMQPLVEADARPIDQSTMYLMGFGRPTSWVAYSTGLPVRSLAVADLSAVAAATPEWRVLIYCGSVRTDGGPMPCDVIDDPSARVLGGVMSVPAEVAWAALR